VVGFTIGSRGESCEKVAMMTIIIIIIIIICSIIIITNASFGTVSKEKYLNDDDNT
jgi:uncharacterized protein YxeA